MTRPCVKSISKLRGEKGISKDACDSISRGKCAVFPVFRGVIAAVGAVAGIPVFASSATIARGFVPGGGAASAVGGGCGVSIAAAFALWNGHEADGIAAATG